MCDGLLVLSQVRKDSTAALKKMLPKSADYQAAKAEYPKLHQQRRHFLWTLISCLSQRRLVYT